MKQIYFSLLEMKNILEDYDETLPVVHLTFDSKNTYQESIIIDKLAFVLVDWQKFLIAVKDCNLPINTTHAEREYKGKVIIFCDENDILFILKKYNE